MTNYPILAAALLLAGCAGPGAFPGAGPFGEAITRVEQRSNYVASQFGAFAAAGARVEMRGPLPGGATAEQVAAALALPGWWPQTPLRAIPPAEAGQGQRIVLIFGADGGVDIDRVCAGGGTQGVARDGLRVGAVLCLGSRPASTATLTRAAPAAPGDPDFTAAMRNLLAALAPPDDRFRERFQGRGDRVFVPSGS